MLDQKSYWLADDDEEDGFEQQQIQHRRDVASVRHTEDIDIDSEARKDPPITMSSPPASGPVQVDPDQSGWRFAQCFGDKGDVEDITEADIIVRT